MAKNVRRIFYSPKLSDNKLYGDLYGKLKKLSHVLTEYIISGKCYIFAFNFYLKCDLGRQL